MKKIKSIFRNFLSKSNTNLIVAGSALAISACALFISVQEVRIMRTQQTATMYPYLTIGTRYSSDGFGIILKNSGNGLARINSYQVFNDNQYFKDWLDVLQATMPEAKNINYGIINTVGNIRNEMIAPGESKNLIFLKWTDETREIEKRLKSLKVTVCYSSLLDEHWQVVDGIPVSLEQKCAENIKNEFGD